MCVCVLPDKCVMVVVKTRSYRRRYLEAPRTPRKFRDNYAFKAQVCVNL